MITLESLQADAMKSLSRMLEPGTHVALLDFPRHQNAGDSFIWLGTLAYLEKLGVTVDYVADLHVFDADDLRRRLPAGPILITGGGNFGDRWKEHQKFRELVISSFPERKIIQLPQSLDFESSAGLAEAQKVLNFHPDLTIMLRQSVDMKRAEEWFPQARRVYCPDLALGLGRLKSPSQATHDAVLLLRQDSESVTRGNVDAFSDMEYLVTDWNLGAFDQFLWKLYRMPENIARVVPASRRPLLSSIQWTYVRAASLNLTAAQKNVSRGRVLVTDRLHGMFLGALMGIPTIALDNANGKVAGVFEDYVSQFPHVQMAESLEDSASKARSVLNSTVEP
ncbi:polysaccharide pyruvyl transferase family protein [Arthrobacter sp. MAHUQ-56]